MGVIEIATLGDRFAERDLQLADDDVAGKLALHAFAINFQM